MPTISQRILDYLGKHAKAADDDELASTLGLKQRQQANICCRQLAAQQLVRRERSGGKIRNFAAGQPATAPAPAPALVYAADRPWFCEGNVQARVVEYLRTQGYTILREANTATFERGKDIEAQKEGRLLWVSVKGYPVGTARTHPSTQAGHWFKVAMFDILVWRGEDPEAALALALPDFPRYRKLLEKVAWLQPCSGLASFG